MFRRHPSRGGPFQRPRQILSLRLLARAIGRKPITTFAVIARHELEMLARLDVDMLIGEHIPAGIEYAPNCAGPIRGTFAVVVPQAFAEQARQLLIPTRR